MEQLQILSQGHKNARHLKYKSKNIGKTKVYEWDPLFVSEFDLIPNCVGYKLTALYNENFTLLVSIWTPPHYPEQKILKLSFDHIMHCKKCSLKNQIICVQLTDVIFYNLQKLPIN